MWRSLLLEAGAMVHCDAEKEHMVTLLPLVSQKIDIRPSELVALAEREREREENGVLMSCELCLTRERYR